jgi:hypothetical protein
MKTNSEFPASAPPSGQPLRRRILVWPSKRLGWWAVAIAAVAVASFVVFPLITMAYRTAYPIVDTWVMPAAMAVLVDTAAILSVLAVWRGRERSVLSILTLVLIVLAALFTTMMVVGESIVP